MDKEAPPQGDDRTPGVSQPTVPARSEAEAFIAALTGDANSAVTFQTFPDDKQSSSPSRAQILNGNLAEHWEELVRLNQAGHGIYVTVNETDLQGRTAENVIALRALFVDEDAGKLAPCDLPLAPSIIVTSKRGPHFYWRLGPGEDLSKFTPAQEALSRRFGTDSKVKDLPRVMRLPGFLHLKDPDSPFMVRVAASNDSSYSIEEVLAGNGATPSEPVVAPAAETAPRRVRRSTIAGAGGRSRALSRARAYLARVPPAVQGEGGDQATYAAAAAMVRDFDLTNEEAMSLLRDWNTGCVPPWSEEELLTKVERARRYGSHAPGEKLASQEPPASPSSGTTDDPLAVLTADSTIPEVGLALKAFAEKVRSYSRSERALAREQAINVVRNVKYVSSPAKLVDAHVSPEPAPSGGLALEDVEPADVPQDTGLLLDLLVDAFERYLVLPRGAAVVLAVWVLHSWVHEAFHFTPRVVIKSPAKRCGKTLVLEILFILCARALQSANLSSAVLYRVIEAFRPTILVDEGDTFLLDNDELRGVLNAGFSAFGSVLRCQGEDLEPKAFKCFAPVAIAAIGTLPATLMDRSLSVNMERKSKAQEVARFDRHAREDLAALRPRLARWALDNEDALRGASPVAPDVLNDRQRDISEPLIAIGDLAGGEWPARIREAVVTLCRSTGDDTDDRREKLLRAVWGLFSNEDFITIQDIVARLLADPESEWHEMARGKPITPVVVGKWLKGFGLKTSQPRSSPNRARGYSREDLQPVAEKYLSGDVPVPHPVSPVPVEANQPRSQQILPPELPRASTASGTGRTSEKPSESAGGTGGTGWRPPPGPDLGPGRVERAGAVTPPPASATPGQNLGPASGPLSFTDEDLDREQP